MWYTYILESLKNKLHYIGFTNNLRLRLKQHNSASFKNTHTYRSGPWKLIYYEAYANKDDAMKSEKFFKSGYGREVLKQKLENYLKTMS